MSHALVDIGILTRTTSENHYLDRLMTSLHTVSAGMPADILVESGEQLTKVEKRVRLFRRSQARLLVLLEDDTTILHDGWLVNLICRMSTFPNTAILNPAETRHPVEEVPEEALNDLTQEVSYCCGFCMVIDRESGIEPDVRVQTLDDLWLSLAARRAGWRCARTEATIIRHTKAPWGSDDAKPADQPDKSRWGADSDYYDSDKHHRKRIHEARLMIQTFGDLARMTLPKELVTHITDPLCDLPDPKVRLQSGIWAEEEIKIGGTI